MEWIGEGEGGGKEREREREREIDSYIDWGIHLENNIDLLVVCFVPSPRASLVVGGGGHFVILFHAVVLCFIEDKGGTVVWLGGCEGIFLSPFQGSQIGQKFNQLPVSVWMECG